MRSQFCFLPEAEIAGSIENHVIKKRDDGTLLSRFDFASYVTVR